MHIAKYLHSCLLFQEAGEKLLFDPGKFSFIEGRVKPDTFKDVSTIVLSHDHPDHIDFEVLKQLIALSGARIVANHKVTAKLHDKGIDKVSILDEGTQQFGAFTLRAIPARHEPILSDELPTNSAFLVNERVLNPGDSFQASLHELAGVELLILPVMAPWLTELAVADFARQIRPQQILPVHDGYAKDFFLKQRYENYRSYFDKLQIKFHSLIKPGDSITL